MRSLLLRPPMTSRRNTATLKKSGGIAAGVGIAAGAEAGAGIGIGAGVGGVGDGGAGKPLTSEIAVPGPRKASGRAGGAGARRGPARVFLSDEASATGRLDPPTCRRG